MKRTMSKADLKRMALLQQENTKIREENAELRKSAEDAQHRLDRKDDQIDRYARWIVQLRGGGR